MMLFILEPKQKKIRFGKVSFRFIEHFFFLNIFTFFAFFLPCKLSLQRQIGRGNKVIFSLNVFWIIEF